jgi:hypothetical protein
MKIMEAACGIFDNLALLKLYSLRFGRNLFEIAKHSLLPCKTIQGSTLWG